MPRPKDKIAELIVEADMRAAKEIAGEDPAIPDLPDNGQPSEVAPGMMRVHIVSPDHTDGIQKKTWLRDSVIELPIADAQWLIDVAHAAYPTDEPINELLTAYKGK